MPIYKIHRYCLNANNGIEAVDLIDLIGDISGAWPIGSVFISVVNTNPATLLGFGTWSVFGAGRVFVGLDSGDTDFDIVEKIGGEKTHVLSPNEVP